MPDFSTDSYPKPPALPVQKSMLDQVGQYQDVESKGISISQQKLGLINKQFELMSQELSTLANDPSITKDAATQRLTTFANTFGFKPEVTNHMLSELQASPDVKSFAQNALVRGMDTQQKVNNLYGTPSMYNNGQQNTPTMTSPLRNGGAPQQAGLPIQNQIPPTTPVYDQNNQPTLQGPTPPMAPPGIATQPGQRLPTTNQPLQQPRPMLPVGKGNLTNDGEVTGVGVQDAPASFAQRYPAPSGPAVGTPPMFEEGKDAYAKAQLNAGAKAQALKPLIQAIPLMQTPGFLSGPLTDQFTKVVAGLKATGLINIANNADPTAIRQEVVKKLNQYLSNSPVGQRSDNALLMKESSSPNPNVQILPALLKLAKDQVGLDRVEIAMPKAFKGNDYQNFSKHVGSFPQSVDERAFTLDQEPEEKSAKLVKEMAIKEQSKNNRDRMEAAKFFKTLRIAKDQGFYN